MRRFWGTAPATQLEYQLNVQGFYTVFDGMTTAWLRPNLGAIVTYVREGTLDFVLLKPIDSQFWLSLRTLAPAGLSEVVLGLALASERYPFEAYSALLRLLFTLVLPVAFLTKVPAEPLLGRTLFFDAARGFCLFALQHYTSASSELVALIPLTSNATQMACLNSLPMDKASRGLGTENLSW